MKEIMTLDELTCHCEYFYDAEDDPTVTCCLNNGYNCRHPEQTEKENGIGCCYSFSCPLAVEADEEDCVKYGLDPEDYEESEYMLVDKACLQQKTS